MKRALVLVAALSLLVAVAACSDDGDNDGEEPTAAPDDTTTTTTTTEPELAYTSDVYSDEAAWLCLGTTTDDHCDRDMDATVVDADGTTSVERFEADPQAPVDCFYVYPTVSIDNSVASDMTAGDNQEILTVRLQAARLGEVCKVYAPVYRQTTLTWLTSRVVGGDPPPGDAATARETAYQDVLDAFRHYLSNHNDGRPFVLVGHSQGSGHLTRLLVEELDADTDDAERRRAQLVSALIVGSAIDADPLRNIPACTETGQTSCVISYAGFRATSPPPPTSFFGRSNDAPALCTNPAALDGDDDDTALQPYLPTGDNGLIGGDGALIEWAAGTTIDTPFVTLPGLLTAECVEDGTFAYLAVTVHGDPADPRIDDIRGDLTPEWGLHLVDHQITMGNLVDVVRAQVESLD
ncbi:MAG TPA: DUF3089 domain-containing protein [Acidimicrobiales bacterium]|nr:DUF3089 domain-containing protein [Acidimicrobiales bacterium]